MYGIVKRILDGVISLIAILLLLPFYFVISFVILISSGTPVFFLQERIGKNWVPFKIIKFRTMIREAENLGPDISSGNDSRITKAGKFLRKFKLDELPQFFNVLKGDMSIIGPRPELFKYANHFKDEYTGILKIKPGITDFASVKYKNEAAMLKSGNVENIYLTQILPDKIILYKKYLNEFGFLTDLKILFNTIKGIIL